MFNMRLLIALIMSLWLAACGGGGGGSNSSTGAESGSGTDTGGATAGGSTTGGDTGTDTGSGGGTGGDTGSGTGSTGDTGGSTTSGGDSGSGTTAGGDTGGDTGTTGSGGTDTGGGSTGGSDTGTGDTGSGSSTGGDAGGTTGGDTTPEPSLEVRTAAANATVSDNALCANISGFDWQIGDKDGVLASGSGGQGPKPGADTELVLASASKWLWGAYVAQVRDGAFSAADIASLTLTSGYVTFNYYDCIQSDPTAQASETVLDCYNAGTNSQYVPPADGRFFYGGGHFQKEAAIDLGLGALNNDTLQQAMQGVLGSDIAFRFDSPQLAAGMRSSENQYAVFLRKILGGGLLMHDLLGTHAVCTNPDSCATAVYSPINDPASSVNTESWHYSLGHWVEDDPTVGDGAFSSVGARGFYPWIDAGKTTYGILSRYDSGDQAAIDSMRCGRAIRKAWFSGEAQP